MSTLAVYGNCKKSTLKEEMPIKPISNYALNKLLAENICDFYFQRKKIDLLIARTGSLYGPGLKRQFIYDACRKIKANKKQVGSDRIANAIGAYYKYKSDCIVLDFGTATTFDVINKGTYWGGIIAPGVNLSLSTLINKADQIPSFTLKKINKVVGKNTISALRSGFYWGYAGLIENILQLIRKETKRNYKIILTGGFSSLFKNSIKSKVFIDKDITMKGLIELLKVK